MANAFDEFTQGIARLKAQAGGLQDERNEAKHEIEVLQARCGEIEALLEDIEAHSRVSPAVSKSLS